MDRRRIVFVLAVALPIAVAVLVVVRRDRPEPPTAPPTPLAGGFVVQVLDPEGRPAAGARLAVHAVSPYRLEATARTTLECDRGGWAAIPPATEPLVAVVSAEGAARQAFPLYPDAELNLDEGSEVVGLVTDLLGRPIAGARVVSPRFPPHVAETITGDDGAFSLGVLADDAWVRAEAPGHAPLELSLSLYPLTGRDFIFHLSPEWRVSGQVVDSDGKGIPGAIVELDQESRSRIAADADGRFSMPGVLPSWEAQLTAHARGRVGPPVMATAGQRGVRIPLYRPAEVRGRAVLSSTGEPVEEIEVWPIDAEILPGGRFRLTGLPPGEIEIEVRSGSLEGEVVADLREGEVREDVVVSLSPPVWGAPDEFGAVYPVVFVATEEVTGAPAAGARVRLLPSDGEGRTGRDGTLTALVPAGTRRLRIGGTLDPWEEAEVEVVVPREEPVAVSLTRNVEVTVELCGGTAVEEAKLWVDARRDRPAPDLMMLEPIEFVGDHVSFPVTAGAELDLFLLVKGFLPVQRRAARVPEDGLIPLFLERGPVIRGRCIGEAGHPLPKALAEAEEDPTNLRFETLGDGRFSVGPVLPGSYRITIYARNVRTRRFEVEVEGVDVDLGDVRLPAPCVLDVQVATSAGEPVPGAYVETSHLVPAKAVTDERGRALLPGRNQDELLRVMAAGYLDAWREVEIPDERRRLDVPVRLLRPARIVVRALDGNGRPSQVLLPDRDDLTLDLAGPGEVVVSELRPGPLTLALEDRDGRRGTLRTIVREGEARVEAVVLE